MAKAKDGARRPHSRANRPGDDITRRLEALLRARGCTRTVNGREETYIGACAEILARHLDREPIARKHWMEPTAAYAWARAILRQGRPLLARDIPWLCAALACEPHELLHEGPPPEPVAQLADDRTETLRAALKLLIETLRPLRDLPRFALIQSAPSWRDALNAATRVADEALRAIEGETIAVRQSAGGESD